MTPKSPIRADRRRALVLVVVLWTLAALAALCLAAAAAVAAGWRQAGGHGRSNRVEMALADGLTAARARLAGDDAADDTLADAWARADESLESADVAGLEFHDEAARLNANVVSAEILANLPELTAASAAAFVRRREQLGPEAPQSGGPALACRAPDGPIATARQLAALLEESFGETGESLEMPAPDRADNSWGPLEMPPRVRSAMAKLTLWSRVRNVAADGTARVNLNTASDEALTGLLAEAGVGGELLSAILRSRRQQPFESIGELLTRVYDVTDLGGMPRTIRLGVGEFAAVADRLTVDPNAVLAGRVNVHTARETVLAALPGLDEESARSIVAARANVDQAVFGSAETVAWLLTVLDEETFAACCESLTVRSQQFRCRIVPGANAEDLSRPRRSAALAVLERDGPRVGCIFWRQWRESPPTTDSQ